MRARFVLGLPEAKRDEAAALYLEAFGRKFSPILGRGERARAYLAATLRPSHAIAALSEDGALLGLSGFHGQDGGFIGGGAAEMRAAFGRSGALWRGLLLSLFEREPRPGELLMDGIAVSPAARGQGIGRGLIEAVCALAAARGNIKVRLEVTDTNPRARALYERCGFTPEGENGSPLLYPLFGFSHATTMTRPADQAASSRAAS